MSFVSMLATLLAVLGVTLCLATLCISPLVALIRQIERDFARAHQWARRLYATSALLTVLLAYATSLPLITTLLSLLLSASLSLPSTSPYLLLLTHLCLPLVSHHSLLSHLSHLKFRSHAIRTAPRLPGGRISWDIPDEHALAHHQHLQNSKIGKASGFLSLQDGPSLPLTVTLFFVLVWGQTFCAWILLIGKEARVRWGLPFVATGSDVNPKLSGSSTSGGSRWKES